MINKNDFKQFNYNCHHHFSIISNEIVGYDNDKLKKAKNNKNCLKR